MIFVIFMIKGMIKILASHIFNQINQQITVQTFYSFTNLLIRSPILTKYIPEGRLETSILTPSPLVDRVGDVAVLPKDIIDFDV